MQKSKMRKIIKNRTKIGDNAANGETKKNSKLEKSMERDPDNV